jgi:hypothetical protein
LNALPVSEVPAKILRVRQRHQRLLQGLQLGGDGRARTRGLGGRVGGLHRQIADLVEGVVHRREGRARGGEPGVSVAGVPLVLRVLRELPLQVEQGRSARRVVGRFADGEPAGDLLVELVEPLRAELEVALGRRELRRLCDTE